MWLLEMIPAGVFVAVLCCLLLLWRPSRVNGMYAFQPMDMDCHVEEDRAMSRYTVHDTYKNSKT